MNKTEPASKVQKKYRYIGRFCSIFLLFSISVWLMAEVYDFVPTRSWLYRQTHTLYFVDLTARLVVDGAPLVLKRTIRCIDQPKPISLEPTPAEDSSVFDALGGVSVNGRTIIINVLKACSFLSPGGYHKKIQETGIIYDSSLTQISQPRVERPDPVFVEYIWPNEFHQYSAEAIKTGRYGIRLDKFIISYSARQFQMFDGRSYDWIGGGGWYSRKPTMLLGYYGYQLPNEFISKIGMPLDQEMQTCTKPCAIILSQKFSSSRMFEGINLRRLERLSLKFDQTQRFFEVDRHNLGRQTFANLPMGTNLGWHDDRPYILYKVGEYSIRAYQPNPEALRNFVYPQADTLLVMDDRSVFYISSSPAGLNVR